MSPIMRSLRFIQILQDCFQICEYNTKTLNSTIDYYKQISKMDPAILEQLKEMFVGVNGRLDRFQQELSMLNQRMGKIQTQVSSMKTQVSSMKTQVSSMKTQVSSMKRQIGSVSIVANRTEGLMIRLNMRLDKLEAKDDSTKDQIATFEHRFKGLQEQTERRITHKVKGLQEQTEKITHKVKGLQEQTERRFDRLTKQSDRAGNTISLLIENIGRRADQANKRSLQLLQRVQKNDVKKGQDDAQRRANENQFRQRLTNLQNMAGLHQ